MLLRYLEEIILLKADKVKQPNGTYIDDFKEISKYRITKQALESEIDAQVYGADIVNMLRLQSPYNKLEKILLTKLNNKEDNISKYFILINGVKYKIKAVNEFRIDIERL